MTGYSITSHKQWIKEEIKRKEDSAHVSNVMGTSKQIQKCISLGNAITDDGRPDTEIRSHW